MNINEEARRGHTSHFLAQIQGKGAKEGGRRLLNAKFVVNFVVSTRYLSNEIIKGFCRIYKCTVEQWLHS